MDFISDALADGRKFRCLALSDDFTRESPAIETDFSLSGEWVVRVLERAGASRGFPEVIVCDNGPEFTSQVLDQWAHERGERRSNLRGLDWDRGRRFKHAKC
jgi:putative transposase